jgi:hypothetical protein
MGDMSSGNFFYFQILSEVKNIQLQASKRPHGDRRLRLLELLDIQHMKVVKVVSLKLRKPYSR